MVFTNVSPMSFIGEADLRSQGPAKAWLLSLLDRWLFFEWSVSAETWLLKDVERKVEPL
jgi:hypothetical protein